MINKCLFPAAGYGTRFLPATKAVPKEMLPILTKPLLQYGVEEALSAGIKDMAIVTGRGKRAIEDHFDNAFELESQLKGTSNEFLLNEIKEVIDNANFTYVRQKEMLGLGHAILTGRALIGNEAFGVILADDLCDCSSNGVMSQLIELYNKYKCSIVAIEEIPQSQIHKYGVICGDPIDGSNSTFRVTNMLEKPAENDLTEFTKMNSNQYQESTYMGIIGRYILTPDIFDILDEMRPINDGEIQITDALLAQSKKGKVIAHKFNGKRFDCGSVEGFIKATNHFVNKKNL